jgi:hypothetical protein
MIDEDRRGTLFLVRLRGLRRSLAPRDEDPFAAVASDDARASALDQTVRVRHFVEREEIPEAGLSHSASYMDEDDRPIGKIRASDD